MRLIILLFFLVFFAGPFFAETANTAGAPQSKAEKVDTKVWDQQRQDNLFKMAPLFLLLFAFQFGLRKLTKSADKWRWQCRVALVIFFFLGLFLLSQMFGWLQLHWGL